MYIVYKYILCILDCKVVMSQNFIVFVFVFLEFSIIFDYGRFFIYIQRIEQNREQSIYFFVFSVYYIQSFLSIFEEGGIINVGSEVLIKMINV